MITTLKLELELLVHIWRKDIQILLDCRVHFII
jgi:hypothetical protein